MEEIEGKQIEESILDSDDNLEENATCDETSDDSREISDSSPVSRKRAIGWKQQQNIKKMKIMTSESGNDVFSVSNSKIKTYSNLVDKLQNENTFKGGLSLLTKLLEQGKCTEETAIEFYLCFQAVTLQYRHLVEKREEDNGCLHFISELFTEIDSLFCLYKQHKIWKFFSQIQKMQMELSIKHFSEWKATINDDLMGRNLDEFDNSCASNSKSDMLAEEQAKILSEEQTSNQTKQIRLKTCVLYPPDSEILVAKKPLGCRTVLVSGLPEKATKEVIEEIFSLCGPIKTIWQPRVFTRFCHVQYKSEIFIENAVQLSGYRLKILDRDESLYSSVIHVVYLAEDDHLNYTCNNFHPDNGNTICIDLTALCEKLKDKHTFSEAATTLITCLEQEHFEQKDADYIYSIIEAINQHFVRDVLIQKDEIEKELSFMNKEESVHMWALISKIYEAALLESYQDNFTEEQKENIKNWKQLVQELIDSFVGNQENIDQDSEISNDQLKEAVSRLEEERDSLKSQLEAAKERLRRVQITHDEEMRVKDAEYDAVMSGLCSLRFHFRLLAESRNEIRRQEEESLEEVAPDSTSLGLGSSPSSSSLHSYDEARLISLISMFINSYPYGARIDDICSYLHQFDSRIEAESVTDLMEKYPNIFREDTTDDGLRRWYFNGFQM